MKPLREGTPLEGTSSTWICRHLGLADAVGLAGLSLGIAGIVLGSGQPAVGQTCGFQWANSLPPEKTILGMEYANGQLVGVGVDGTVITSVDGSQWETHYAGTDQPLVDVAYGNGLFVAVGLNGVIVTSPDGVVWTQQAQTGATFTWVESGGGMFVAAGYGVGPGVFSSHDGLSWEPSGLLLAEAITWDGQGFIAAGLDGFERSEDGMTWAPIAPFPDGGAIGPSGPTEDKKTLDEDYGKYKAMAWDGTQLLYFTSWQAELYSSTDGGVTWDPRHAVFPDQMPSVVINNTVLAAGGRIVVSSNAPSPYGVFKTELHSSADGGTTWVEQSYLIPGGLPGLAWDGSRYWAVGDQGQMLLSPDAAAWSCVGVECYGSIDHLNLRDVIVTPDGLLAVGGVEGESATVFLRSSDGETWNVALYDPLGLGVNGVAFNGERYVGVGDHYAYWSTDGFAWHRVLLEWWELSSAVFGEGVFVAVGNRGDILTTADGVSWVEQDSGTDQRLYSVTWGGGRFIAVGAGGTILLSEDGIMWTAVDSGTETSPRHVIYAGSMFLASGEVLLGSMNGVTWAQLADFPVGALVFTGQLLVGVRNGGMFASIDGLHWTSFPGPANEVNGVAWTGDAFCAVGDHRGIYRATCIGTLVRFAPELLDVFESQSRSITVILSEAVSVDTAVSVTCSDPSKLAVPTAITVASGTDRAVIVVRGVAPGEVTITATVPQDLGAGSASATVIVHSLPAGPSPPIPMLSRLGLGVFAVAIAGIGTIVVKVLSGE